MTAAGKRCVVAYAIGRRQFLWKVGLQPDATIADAIDAARRLANEPDVPWDTAPVGIYGEIRKRSDRPADGDRVEIYRPLKSDPRDRRREQVQRARKAARG